MALNLIPGLESMDDMDRRTPPFDVAQSHFFFYIYI